MNFDKFLACNKYELVGYECGMVMRWVETLYSWVEYDELVWIWPRTWKGLVI